MKKKGIYAAGAVFSILLIFVLTRLFEPKYMGTVIEGNFTEEYYREDTPHDLLIIGNCESYENISTMKLWEEYGITSYIRGNSNQLIPQSYYLLKEALKQETPKVVLLNIQAMMVEEQDTEEYNRMVFDQMRWSSDKLEAIKETKMEQEHVIEYMIPLLRYHDRWKTLEQADFQYAFGNKPVTTHNGYYLRADIRAADGEFPAERRQADYTFSEINQRYLEEIRLLCEEHGIALVLMKAPSLYPIWSDPYEEQIEGYAQEHGILYLNTLEKLDEIGIDFQTDTYDEGLHLNVYGAEKVSVYLGELLQMEYELPDHRDEAGISEIYQEKMELYQADKITQESDFKEYGYIPRYTNVVK